MRVNANNERAKQEKILDKEIDELKKRVNSDHNDPDRNLNRYAE